MRTSIAIPGIPARTQPRAPHVERLWRRWAHRLAQVQAVENRVRRELLEAVTAGKTGRVMKLAKRLAKVQRERWLLEKLQKRKPSPHLSVVLSSVMLARSFEVCTERPEEGMHFIAGFDFDGLRIGTHIVPFPYSERSVVGASGDHLATQRLCAEIHEAGHTIVALMHAHPGSGQAANHPSSVDIRTQRLWEQTSRLVGGIWARDGFLRWYSVNVDFDVEIVGNNLEKIDARQFKLVPLES